MVPDDDARAALQRLIGSDHFREAGRLSVLLRYVVVRTLAGEGDYLTEYRIGVDVYNRPEEYSPRLDPIVRYETAILRAKLEEYYAGPGKDDPVRLSIPEGAFTAAFEPAPPPPPPPAPPALPAHSAAWPKWLGVGLLLVGLAAAFIPRDSGQPPAPTSIKLAVIPNASADAAAVADSLAESLTIELDAYTHLHAIPWPTVTAYRTKNPRAAAQLAQTARDLSATFLVVLNVRRIGSTLQVSVSLLDPASNWRRALGDNEYDPVTASTVISNISAQVRQALHERAR